MGMHVTVVTGLCGSGKTSYCRDKPSLSYDSVFSYATQRLDYQEIDSFMRSNKSEAHVFLDAFSKDQINYVVSTFNVDTMECVVLYTDIDAAYECITITEPRDFGEETYDDHVQSIIASTENINSLCKQCLNERVFTGVKYLYRNGSDYTEHNDDAHLQSLLSQSKKDRLLEFVDRTSGDKGYQSITLDGECVRRGAEKDWITLENILRCTSLEDKVVVDTGCFNGYFSFKALELGAKKVIGIDQNLPALNICRKLAIYNHHHVWKDGRRTDNSCEHGIHFYERRIGVDNMLEEGEMRPSIDIVFALNYLHHLINAYGKDAFNNAVDSFFKISKEVVFEVNESEIDDIGKLAEGNGFTLNKRLESHRDTSFGKRSILHFTCR